MTPILVNAREAATLLGIGLRSLHKFRHDPSFPAPLALGARATRWKVGELIAWAESRPRVDARAEPAELAAAPRGRVGKGGKKLPVGGTAGGRSGGTLTHAAAKARRARPLASGAGIEPPAGGNSNPSATPK